MKHFFSKGFTLVEVMTVSAISVILIGSLLVFVVRGFRIINSGEKGIELQQELNRAVIWISDDLRQTATSKINLPADGQWRGLGSFNIPDEDASGNVFWTNNWGVVYSLSGGNLTRAFRGQNMVVAGSLSRAVYRRSAANLREVQVALNVTDLTPLTQMRDAVIFNVTMRN